MKKENKILLLILCMSFILNIINITWGFPAIWDVDTYVRRTLALAARRSPFPPDLGYGTLLPYMGAAILSPYFIYLKIIGMPLTSTYLNTSAPEFYTTVYFIARFVNVIFSVLIVYMTYRLAKELFNQKVGLLSALLLAVTPGFVSHSIFTSVDIVTIFLMITGLFLLAKFIRTKNEKLLLVFGFVAGLAFSAKYYFGITLIYPFLLSQIYVYKKNFIQKHWIKIGSLFILAFLMTTPAIILKPSLTTRAISEHSRFVIELLSGDGERGISEPYGFISHLTNLNYALGGLIAIVCIPIFVGKTLALLYKFDKKIFFLSFWALSYYFSISIIRFSPIRAVIPLLPPLLIIFSHYLFKMASPMKLLYIIPAIFVIYGLLQSLLVHKMVINDTRYEAAQWIKDNIPSGSTILVTASDKYIPVINKNNALSSDLDRVPYTGLVDSNETPNYFIKELDQVRQKYHEVISDDTFSDFQNNFTREYYGSYFILSDSYYGRFFDEVYVEGAHSSKSFPLITKFYQNLLNESYGPILADFYYDNSWPTIPYISPRITIIKIEGE